MPYRDSQLIKLNIPELDKTLKKYGDTELFIQKKTEGDAYELIEKKIGYDKDGNLDLDKLTKLTDKDITELLNGIDTLLQIDVFKDNPKNPIDRYAKYQRTFGIYSENVLEALLKRDIRTVMNAFTAGINNYTKRADSMLKSIQEGIHSDPRYAEKIKAHKKAMVEELSK
ncbi:hypothetical protein DRJ17_03465 [Candidatus Woesearchaeota archaeon]|nr:MAG: hypothetical protein DRJ17_03465 [Candidatus Woesearchaeota archaeon]